MRKSNVKALELVFTFMPNSDLEKLRTKLVAEMADAEMDDDRERFEAAHTALVRVSLFLNEVYADQVADV